MDSNRRNYSSNVYTFNNFLDSLKMLSDTNTESTSQCEKKEQKGKEEERNELSELKKENLELRAMVEQLKGDLQKENAFNNEFNINFDLMQNKYQNDIKAIEIMNEEKEKKNRGYLKIRPETDITVEECTAFWNSLFRGEEA